MADLLSLCDRGHVIDMVAQYCDVSVFVCRIILLGYLQN